MTHAQSARAFEIRTAKQEFLSWQQEYRIATRDLNKYRGPVTRSICWTIFNHARQRYLKSMAQLRSALKTPKGDGNE